MTGPAAPGSSMVRCDPMASGVAVTNHSMRSSGASAIRASSSADTRRAPFSTLASADRSSEISAASSAWVLPARVRAATIRSLIALLSRFTTCAI